MKFNYEVLLMNCTFKMNIYRIPLCIINGVTGMNTTFYVRFCFLFKKRSENYVGMLKVYKNFLKFMNIFNFIVFVTDFESDLISAISQIYSEAEHLLCLGHINKNVLINCRNGFENDEAGKTFYATGNTVLYVKTKKTFENAGNVMQLKHQNDFVFMNYF